MLHLIVGLGNLTPQYSQTRHNLGFLAVDEVIRDLSTTTGSGFSKQTKYKALLYWGEKQNRSFLLVKPQTYMNCSGDVVRRLYTVYGKRIEQMIVMYDDCDLPFGRVKVQSGGSAGGHRGVESIIEAVGQHFVRVRCGIGRPMQQQGIRHTDQSIVSYVLGTFSTEEQAVLGLYVRYINRCLFSLLEHGIEKTANTFHGRFFMNEMDEMDRAEQKTGD